MMLFLRPETIKSTKKRIKSTKKRGLAARCYLKSLSSNSTLSSSSSSSDGSASSRSFDHRVHIIDKHLAKMTKDHHDKPNLKLNPETGTCSFFVKHFHITIEVPRNEEHVAFRLHSRVYTIDKLQDDDVTAVKERIDELSQYVYYEDTYTKLLMDDDDGKKVVELEYSCPTEAKLDFQRFLEILLGDFLRDAFAVQEELKRAARHLPSK